MSPPYLTSIIQQLVLKLLNAKNLLEHLIQLVLAENELGGSAGCHALLVFAWVFLSPVDGVEFGDPRAQDRLLAQTIDLRQAADTFLDVLLKDLTGVTGGATTALDHTAHTVTFKEHL